MKYVLSLSAMLMLLASCKKETISECPDPVPGSPAYNPGAYFNASPGNYWVYDYYNVDTLGNASLQGTDSVYVISDTVIGGHNYDRISGTWFGMPRTWNFRSSGGYVVDESGFKLFSDSAFNTVIDSSINAGLTKTYYRIISPAQNLTTGAGTFSCLDNEGQVEILVASYPWANPRYVHQYRAKDIGMIKEVVFYFSQPGTIERRLARYHVQ